MKTITTLLFLTWLGAFLGSCGGASDFFDSLVPDTAMQRYIDSGASSIHIRDMNATTPITVTASASGNNMTHPVSNCTFSWDVQQLDPVNYAFWLTQTITVTYDADLFQCGSNTYRCSWNGDDIQVIGGVVDAPVSCVAQP